MPNQYKNKIIYGNQTLIDLTQDTVTAASMLSGVTAHDCSGATVTGTIQTRSISDVTVVNSVLTVPAGYYSTAINSTIPGVELTAPESGTNSFYVTLPNGANDTITLIFTVDANGNSDVTEDATNAYGVSY